jgi:hypothetical protein
MSKRYGRNQKRKAREQIARLELEKQQMREQIEHHHSTIMAARDIVNMVQRIQPMSIIFRPSQIHPDHYRSSDDRFSPMVRLNQRDYQPSMIDIRTIDLYDLEVEISEFKDMVHFECTMFNPNNGKLKSAYRISAEGFKYQPTDKIVEELVRHLKHNVGGIN